MMCWLHALETKVAVRLSRFAGSMLFVYLHALGFALWIAFGPDVGDPWPYAFLTMAVSLEAVFLTAFVLITQNRLEQTIEEQQEEEEEGEREFDEDVEEIQADLDILREGMEALRKAMARVEKRIKDEKASREPPDVLS